MLAVIQAWTHLVQDYDRIILPISVSKSRLGLDVGSEGSKASAMDRIKAELPRRAQAGFLRCLSMAFIGPVCYSLFLRRTVWSWTISIVKHFLGLPRSSLGLPNVPPYHINVILRSVLAGFLLVLLWETSTIAFEAFLAQEPLKQGLPLTQSSKDPNGTLINGLNSKRSTLQVSRGRVLVDRGAVSDDNWS